MPLWPARIPASRRFPRQVLQSPLKRVSTKKGPHVHNRPEFPKRAVVTAGMPYGNKGLHFGHIAGVFVPADVYARFLRDRIGSRNVLFVSGTDCYGSPINEGYRKLVEQEGFDGSIGDYVQRNHDAQKSALDSYDISLDIYEGSGIGLAGSKQDAMTDAFITRLYENGWLEKRSTPQFYDEAAGTFLNGRQVIGRCPVQGCKSDKAYADECDLGHQFDPVDLIAPKSALTGQTPQMRDVTNWYFKLPAFRELIAEHVSNLEVREGTRRVLVDEVNSFLAPPVIYIQETFADDFAALASELPEHTVTPAEKGKSSFAVEFANIEERERAVEIMHQHGLRLRTGKTLVPFRLTGNIDWGVKAPVLDGTIEGATVWCWPESLWAPIAFTQAALEESGRDPESWREWWCSDDARVYQFIGQDNLYFYGVAQTALWPATQVGHDPHVDGTGDDLRQTTLVPNYHILFMGKKASSSGAIKPPMAAELLDYYTPEQLRAHWISLGLGMKPASFSPKPLDPYANEKAPDPVLKESALLTNIFNRIARSCFYTAQKACSGTLPLGGPSQEVRDECERAVLAYEEHMHRFEMHMIMAQMDEFLRGINKWWARESRAALAEDALAGSAEVLLRDAFYYLKCALLLMHPIVPHGCELIFEYLDIDAKPGTKEPCAGFFNWKHVFEPVDFWASDAERATGAFTLRELPPRFDFFEKHPSQYD